MHSSVWTTYLPSVYLMFFSSNCFCIFETACCNFSIFLSISLSSVSRKVVSSAHKRVSMALTSSWAWVVSYFVSFASVDDACSIFVMRLSRSSCFSMSCFMTYAWSTSDEPCCSNLSSRLIISFNLFSIRL